MSSVSGVAAATSPQALRDPSLEVPGRPRAVAVYTHRAPDKTADALAAVISAAKRLGVELRFDPAETSKHSLRAGEGIVVDAADPGDVQLSIVLGGDGTILGALRRFAYTGVPVFGVNFGQIGFLASVEPEELDDGLARAFSGDFELLHLPAIVLATAGTDVLAINDVAIHRRVGERVADVAYALGGEVLGSVRCDGLVVATPAGSTGYSLANGGPVMAWGVEGFVVSFIAPHSLTARALVAAPGDLLTVHNRSR